MISAPDLAEAFDCATDYEALAEASAVLNDYLSGE